MVQLANTSARIKTLRNDNDDSQIGTIVPHWIGEISAKGVDQNLILVEF